MRKVEIDWMFRGGAAAIFPKANSPCTAMVAYCHLAHRAITNYTKLSVVALGVFSGGQHSLSLSEDLCLMYIIATQAWSSFVGHLDEEGEQEDPLMAYYNRLTSDSASIRAAAVRSRDALKHITTASYRLPLYCSLCASTAALMAPHYQA